MKKPTYLALVVLFLLTVGNLQTYPILASPNFQATFLTTLGHGTVNDIEVSPDGETIAVGGSDGIWLYTADDFEDVGHFSVGDQVNRLAWNPKGTQIAIRTRLNGIEVWDVTTGTRLASFPSHNESFPRAIAWSRDNKWLAISRGNSSRKAIEVIDTENWNIVYRLNNPTDVDELTWHSNTQYLLSQSSTNISIWDITSQSVIAQFPYEHNYFVSTEWQPNSDKVMIWLNNERAITIWDIHSDEVSEIFQYEGVLVPVAWNLEHNLLAALEEDSVVLLDLTEPNSISKTVLLENIEPFGISLDWSADGQKLIAFGLDSTIRVWNIVEENKLTEMDSLHNLKIDGIDWCSHADLIASAEQSEQINAIKIWDANDGSLLYKYFNPLWGTLNTVNWHPKEKILLASYFYPYPGNGDTLIWDFSQGYDVQPRILHHEGNVFSAMWSEQGDKFFTVSQGEKSSINVWDTETLSLIETIPTDNSTVGVFPSHSANLVAIVHSFNSGFENNFIEIYDVDSKTTELTIYLPDNKFAFNTPVIWDGADKVLLIHGTSVAKGAVWLANLTTSELSEPYYGPKRSLDWNLESDRIALAGEEVYLLSDDLENIYSIEELPSIPISVSWNQSGDKIAVATQNNSIQIFAVP